ncbi:MAG: DUF4760 domain-containing protein [Proteobacteria bacterium]|nr:DUF4760 domain-containing protein [Pseudomonadota bacterium]
MRWLTALKNNVFIYYLRYLTACFFVLLIVAAFLRCNGLINVSETIRLVGHCLTVLAILFAGFQFKANHDWNRRQLAITASKSAKDSTYSDIVIIDEKFQYINHRKHESIPVDTIHKAMCVKDEKGELKYFNGKLRVDHENDGIKIERALSHYLNTFEYIATGVTQGVFDEEIIYKLYGGPVIRAAGIFKDYIQHINTDMYPGRRGKIYENLIHLAKKFEERETEKEQKERGKTA